MSLSGNQFPELQSFGSLVSSSLRNILGAVKAGANDFDFGLNPKYQEILKLDKILTIAGIPHMTTRLFDGWKTAYILNGKEVSDVAEHFMTCHTGEDLLEIRGLDCLIKVNPAKVVHIPEIYAGMNTLEVFALWSRHYRKSNPHYRKGDFLMAWREILKTDPESEECKILGGCYYLSRAGAEKLTVNTLEYLSGTELTELAAMAVLFGDTEFVTVLTSYQTRKHLISYILDELILTAIRQKNYEIQLMLTNYKYRHNLFRGKKFEL